MTTCTHRFYKTSCRRCIHCGAVKVSSKTAPGGLEVFDRKRTDELESMVADAVMEVQRLRNVIRIGGAMYRAERAALGIPGGIDNGSRTEKVIIWLADKAMHLLALFEARTA